MIEMPEELIQCVLSSSPEDAYELKLKSSDEDTAVLGYTAYNIRKAQREITFDKIDKKFDDSVETLK